MAGQYQLASDGFDGHAYSGVIRSDGRWVACAANSDDWTAYDKWLTDDPVNNKPDPYLSPANGGVTITLQEGEVAVGSMLDSLPPEPAAQAPAQAPQAPGHRPATGSEARAASVTVEHSTTTVSGRAHHDG